MTSHGGPHAGNSAVCALCGVLGSEGHWTDAVARPGIFTPNTDSLQRRRERLHRVACAQRVLRHFGLTFSDWQGASYVLSTATGKTEIVDSIAHLWATAERVAGRPCDPLDPALIARLEADRG